MKFGVFDHLDASGEPLGAFYENRLRLVEAYERIGIHCYHTAEHHATTLGMAPSPSVLHAAIAQRTKRILFGPLVYILSLYHPLRLAEEVCMLDHMSGGRFQLGVGRGISPHELGYFGTDPAQASSLYIEAFAVMMKAFAGNTLTHEGKHFSYRDVPVTLHPLQKPHPPLWYGVGNIEGVAWCVENRVNAVVNGPLARVREMTDRYRAEWRKTGQPADGMPLVGTTRHVVIADTEAEAVAVARRAYARWYESFMQLWRLHGTQPMFALFPDNFDDARARGLAAVGTPAGVREALAEQIEKSGVNYLLLRFAFGDVSLPESLRSVELFSREVMPCFLSRNPSPSPTAA